MNITAGYLKTKEHTYNTEEDLEDTYVKYERIKHKNTYVKTHKTKGGKRNKPIKYDKRKIIIDFVEEV